MIAPNRSEIAAAAAACYDSLTCSMTSATAATAADVLVGCVVLRLFFGLSCELCHN